MKLKEYPPSLRMMWRLKRLPDELIQRRPDVETDLPVTVSLTSIPSRLNVVHLTIRSLLNQSRLPRKIVMWLHESLAEQLPPVLSRLQSKRFEIRYSDQNCSHRKLVHPLEQFPEETVITVDDDVMYHPDCLSVLYEDHLSHPRDVIAHECRVITYEQGELAPYKSWPWEQPGQSHEGTLPIGFGGTLYPAGCLHPDTTRSDLYLDLAPRSDDMWFKVMALQMGTQARRCSAPCPRPLPIPFSQKVSLQKTNVRKQGNVEQWQRLASHFDL
ncbi:glycosyltransferase [Natronospirillum operosum]|uniref:Glycosyltransferase n=1 Tax=Natronospirillum operosum TaxID=2759953 RepID=A0A4Z0WH40_9GAMM|nr:glycosyltransferase [Natronospirillum operosum]TGG95267.1 glycosyltransferase [Natronospirillum operosum]